MGLEWSGRYFAAWNTSSNVRCDVVTTQKTHSPPFFSQDIALIQLLSSQLVAHRAATVCRHHLSQNGIANLSSAPFLETFVSQFALGLQKQYNYEKVRHNRRGGKNER